MIGQKGTPALSGGVERHVEEISKRLVEKGHEVTVYCRSTYSENRLDNYYGIKLRYIATSPHKNFEAIIYTFRASINVLFGKYDIIHYHALGPASLSFIPKLFGNKVVVTVHGLDWKRQKWGKFARLYLKLGEKIAAKFSNRIISVSENLRNYLLSKYNINPIKIIYVPNGVNIGELKEPKEIEKYKLTSGSYILFLARLVPEKGAHYLIEAYKKLKTDKKLVIAGGSSYTDDYIKRLKQISSEKIIFTGNVSGRMLEELYSNAYVYVLPSDIEGMPITLLEAMSYSRCCLVSDIPENAQLIKDKLGFTFKRGDVMDLRQKMAYLLDKHRVVGYTGYLAHEAIKMEYNWDSVLEQTERVYVDLFNE